MSRLITVATQMPPHRLELDHIHDYVEAFANLWGVRAEVLYRILNNAKVGTRYSVLPIEEIIKGRTFKENNDLFAESAISLGQKAVEKCLEQATLDPKDIDLLITVSCTGFMIPSVDSYLIDRLGMRRDCKRLPITELGCAAGAVGLSRAHEYIKAYPSARVLVLAAEFPTLTFQVDDFNMAHIVSSIIFGDGVACALVAGQSDSPGLRILDNQSYLYPESSRYMGFDVDDKGFHIVLDKCIPFVVRDTIGELLAGFLGKHALSIPDLGFYALHPAGKKVLAFMEERLEIPAELTRSTWEVLRENGNMSSVSILCVLQRMMSKYPPEVGSYGIILGFGPGFSAEMLLARWEA